MRDKRNLVWSIIAVVASALALSGLADGLSEEYAEAAFKRALVTFAVARGLNGVISVAQGTEVAVEPGDVGVNFTVGQILDPINDLVEQFSSVMLVATSSLGLQNVLLNITGWWGLTVFLVAATIVLLAFQLWPNAPPEKLLNTILRVFLVALFLRFAVPALVIGTTVVFDAFLAAEQETATSALKATSSEIEDLSREESQPQSPDGSLFDRLGDLIEADEIDAFGAELIDRFGKLPEEVEHLLKIVQFQEISRVQKRPDTG